MEGNYWTGIDISKEQLDWQVNQADNQQLTTGIAQNSPRGIATLLEIWARQGIPLEEMIVCFEHTGPYGLLLAAGLHRGIYPLRQRASAVLFRRECAVSPPIRQHQESRPGQRVALRTTKDLAAQWRTIRPSSMIRSCGPTTSVNAGKENIRRA